MKIRKTCFGVVLSFVMLCAISLASIEVQAAAKQEKENNDDYKTANSLTVNDDWEGALEDSSDEDYYKFTINKPGYVYIAFGITNSSEDDGFVDMAICEEYRYYDPEEGDYFYGVDDISKFQYYAGNAPYVQAQQKIGLSAGTYYLRIEGCSIGEQRNYKFRLNYTASGVWENEAVDNDHLYTTAINIKENTTYYGTCGMYYDYDWYKFTIDKPKYVSITSKAESYNATKYYTWGDEELYEGWLSLCLHNEKDAKLYGGDDEEGLKGHDYADGLLSMGLDSTIPLAKNETKKTKEILLGKGTYYVCVRGNFSNYCFSINTNGPLARANQKGSDGTALGKGASAEAAEKAILSSNSDEGPKGSKFAPLLLRSTKQGNTNINLAWNKASKATKYVVYGNACGKKNKMKKLATVKTNKYNVKKIAKKLKKGTYHKFMVVALDKNNNVVSTSKVIHVATKGNKKIANPTKLTVKTPKPLKKGKTFKLSAKQVGKNVKKHRGITYETSNAKIATVNKKGVIKAVKKGTCYIYAYTQNGLYKKVKVVVK